MGKRGNERRKLEKKLFRMLPQRWVEDEFGNKKLKVTKAEARRRFIRHFEARLEFEAEIVEALSRRALSELVAREDARVFESLKNTLVSC